MFNKLWNPVVMETDPKNNILTSKEEWYNLLGLINLIKLSC